jgi:hypothetical protein
MGKGEGRELRGVDMEGDGVPAGSDETEAGNGMCASSRSSSEIVVTESTSGSRTINGARGVVGSSEGMLSKSLGYISAVTYDDLSEIGFSAVTYSVSGSDGGIVGSEWYDEIEEGALGVTYPSLPDVALA